MSFCPKTGKAGISSQGLSEKKNKPVCSGEECLAAFCEKKRGGGGEAGSPPLGKSNNFSVKQMSSNSVIKLQVKVCLCKPSDTAPGKLYQWKLWCLGN